MRPRHILGFYKVQACTKDSEGKIYDEHTFWEWGFSFKIPFSKRNKTRGNEE